METKDQWRIYSIYIGSFFILNILNTYMLTVQGLNRYIAPFKHTITGELSAFLGNFSVLLLISLLAFLVIKKAKARMLFLLVLTFILNFYIFWMGVFNLFFGTAFSIPAATIFNNPSDGFAMGTFLNALLELVTYFRIIVFWPFIILLTLYILSNRKVLSEIRFKISIRKYLSGILLVMLMLFMSIFSYYEQYKTALPLNSAKSTFAVQNLGVYPYYLGEFIGQPFDLDLQKFLDLENEDDLAAAFQKYNKNQTSYVNYFDSLTYSNRLTMSQAVNNIYIDPTIANGDSLHGILEGRNMVLIHLESLNSFLLQHEDINERLIFMNQLLSESFVFNNFYNNVGMGVSSDGELSVLTGLYPMGDRTLYWEYNNIEYQLNSIPDYFNQKGYHTEAIHGDNPTFYNRDQVYPELFGFDNFYSLEDFVEEGYDVKEGYLYDETNNLRHVSPWISDYHLADYTFEFGTSLVNNGTPFMLFSITMMPHTPYEFDPNGFRTNVYPQYNNLISGLTMRYINYVDYVDDVLKRFFISETGTDQTLDNTVYVFYSDHGSGIKNGDLDVLFNRDLSVLETRQMLQQVPAWIYVPGDEYVNFGDYQIRKGLITGEQNLVRSQVDLYRTMIELFNLPVMDNAYYGVHGMSTEPTFALDNRLLDVALDNYFASMRNPEKVFPESEVMSKSTYQYILRFKQLSDIIVSKGDIQKTIDDAILRIYG
ncbi:MAG: LTA synthase family protein [Firmicutes bacterium]|nr:LTA synthase family protein [Bacillota bacterium]